jgi:hypothetical protein
MECEGRYVRLAKIWRLLDIFKHFLILNGFSANKDKYSTSGIPAAALLY